MTEEPQKPHDPIPSDSVRDDPSFPDLVVDFVNGLDERLRRMEEAIGRQNLDAVRRAAHQLKGSGGGYGYPILTERAAELERFATSGSLDQCAETLAELRRICQRIVVSTD